MKVLSIGNSFSQDAHRWLYQLASVNGFDMQTANLYIGGCSLEMHWNNVMENSSRYELQRNGGVCEQIVSIAEALDMDEWDIITLQQKSRYSGMPQTYIPYLTSLADFVREKQPQAKLCFHQTWAYEIDFPHESFLDYNRNQKEMFRRIKDCSLMASKLIDAKLIPTGTVIQKLRETVPMFDYQNGGLSLCRDGFHLSYDYGRFAAAATWFHTLTEQKMHVNTFEDFDTDIIQKIIACVENYE